MFGAILGSVGNLASTALGNYMSSKEAQRNREWQERMSNTAIQRRMSDMRKAGVNPLLAVGSASQGASTPMGGQADIYRFDPSSLITSISSAVALKRQQAREDKLADAQIKKTEADTNVASAKALGIAQENGLIDYKTDAIKLQNDLSRQGLNIGKLKLDLQKTSNEREKFKLVADKLQNTKLGKELNLLDKRGSLMDKENSKLKLIIDMLEVDKGWQRSEKLKGFLPFNKYVF